LTQTSARTAFWVELPRPGRGLSTGLERKLDGAQLCGATLALVVALAGYHHHRQLGILSFDLGQQIELVHPRHVDVRQDRDRGRLAAAGELAQRVVALVGEAHPIRPFPHLAVETLTGLGPGGA